MFVLFYSDIFVDFAYIEFTILNFLNDPSKLQNPLFTSFSLLPLMTFYKISLIHTVSSLKYFYLLVIDRRYQTAIQPNFRHFDYYPIIKMFHSYKQPRFVHHSQKTFLPNDTSYVMATHKYIHDHYFLNKQKPNIYHFLFLPSLLHLNVIDVTAHKFKNKFRFS